VLLARGRADSRALRRSTREQRVREARAHYANAGTGGHTTVPGATVEDWGNCGQCTDCFNGAFSYRPGGAAQYILARGHFASGDGDGDADGASDGEASHVRLGFIASSDNHSARPGTGYKEVARHSMADAAGPISRVWRERIMGEPEARAARSRAHDPTRIEGVAPFKLVDLERQGSFFMTGGLVAVHSAGRDRVSIWDALQRREVYGTSGERMLLWFDLANAPGGPAPMGAEVTLAEAPRFTIRAAGAFEQLPGCPDHVSGELPAADIERICVGECYNPGNRRRRITRIEVVRIRPQRADDEPIESLIDDPWRVLPCSAGGEMCEAEVTDDELLAGDGRGAIYYARAIQEPTPAINAGGLRCADEACSEIEPCYGDYRTPAGDDCLTDNEERAWSSPIFVDVIAPAGDAPAGDAPAGDEVAP
jgi:hypothetical protein